MADAGVAGGLALVAALAAVAAVRAPARWVPAAAISVVTLPVAIVLLDPELRIFSHHGFLHASYVEAILARGLPPTDPLVAEAPLGYAWLHHAAIAGLVRATGLHASTWFAVTGVALLAVCTAVLSSGARRGFRDSGAQVLAPLLALYGASPFPRGPLARGLQELGVDPEPRLLPVQKFASVNSNPLGILCFAWALVALFRLADPDEPAPRRAAAHLFAATLGAAWLYPLTAPAVVGAAGLTGVALLVRDRAVRAAWLPWAAAGAATLLAAPYLLGLQRGKETASVVFDPSWSHVSGGLLQTALALGPPLLLLLVGSRTSGSAGLGAGARLALPAAGVAALVLGLTFSAGMGSEYKFFALAALCAGFAAGGAWGPIARRRPLASALLLALLLWPAASFFVRAWSHPWGGSEAVRVVGPRLEASDPDLRALAEWVRAETAPEAVFVDASLDLPPFAGRRLYVALDPPARAAAGWGVLPSHYLTTVVGHGRDVVRARSETARRLLGAQAAPGDLARLERELGDLPVFVVARTPTARGRLRAAREFTEVFASGPVGVYHLAR